MSPIVAHTGTAHASRQAAAAPGRRRAAARRGGPPARISRTARTASSSPAASPDAAAPTRASAYTSRPRRPAISAPGHRQQEIAEGCRGMDHFLGPKATVCLCAASAASISNTGQSLRQPPTTATASSRPQHRSTLPCVPGGRIGIAPHGTSIHRASRHRPTLLQAEASVAQTTSTASNTLGAPELRCGCVLRLVPPRSNHHPQRCGCRCSYAGGTISSTAACATTG